MIDVLIRRRDLDTERERETSDTCTHRKTTASAQGQKAAMCKPKRETPEENKYANTLTSALSTVRKPISVV